MDHETYNGAAVSRPPLRRFVILTNAMVSDGVIVRQPQTITIEAHLVFNNAHRGEGLVFRRYYDDSVRTEKVAEFESGYWASYFEAN